MSDKQTAYDVSIYDNSNIHSVDKGHFVTDREFTSMDFSNSDYKPRQLAPITCFNHNTKRKDIILNIYVKSA